MTINLKYFFPVLAFYAPGALMLTGAWMLGYTTDESRELVAFFGGFSGIITSSLCLSMLDMFPSIPFHIGKKPAGGE